MSASLSPRRWRPTPPDASWTRLGRALGYEDGPARRSRPRRRATPTRSPRVARLGSCLGVGIANLINTFDPHEMVIGGGVSAAGDLLLRPAIEAAWPLVLPGVGSATTIRLARHRTTPAFWAPRCWPVWRSATGPGHEDRARLRPRRRGPPVRRAGRPHRGRPQRRRPRDLGRLPHAAAAGARTVLDGTHERAIVVCGSGAGVAVAASKIRGIRAACCHDTYTAAQCVTHDDCNVLCLGARVVGPAVAQTLVLRVRLRHLQRRGAARAPPRPGRRPRGVDRPPFTTTTRSLLMSQTDTTAVNERLAASPRRARASGSTRSAAASSRRGELSALVEEDSLRGVTSNPAIFEKAILGADEYDDQIDAARRPRARTRARSTRTIADPGRAGRGRRPAPGLRRRPAAPTASSRSRSTPTSRTTPTRRSTQAREYWERVDRPNLMIKIPGTDEGLPGDRGRRSPRASTST